MSVESIKTRAKKKKPTLPWHKRYRVLIIIMAAFLLMVAAYATVTSIQYYNEASDARLKMETYLEDKYGKDFVVEKPQLTGSGFAVPGRWKAQAHLANDRELVFKVSKEQDQGVYFDEYPGMSWRQQAYEYVEPLLEKTLEDAATYKIEVKVYGDSVNGELPSFKDALTKYGSDMGVSIKIISQENIDDTNKLSVAQQVHQIITGLRDLNVTTFLINYEGKDGGRLYYSYPFGKTSIVENPQDLLNFIKSKKD